MVTESSHTLYLCPVCSRAFREEQECRNHITTSKSDGHSGKNGHDLAGPLDIRYPQPRQFPVERWADVLDNYAEGEEVKYVQLADQLDIPAPFAGMKLGELGYDPVPHHGLTRSAKSWDELTEKQQDTLLAWAYFPDLSHEQLADHPLSGHIDQSSVSTTIRRYGWVFSTSMFDTPFSVTELEQDAEVDHTVAVEGDTTFEDMMETADLISTGAVDPDEVVSSEEARETLDEEPVDADADDKLDELVEEHSGPEMAEDPGAEQTEEDEGVTLAVDEDTAYNALVAAVEAGDLTTAYELWEVALDD